MPAYDVDEEGKVCFSLLLRPLLLGNFPRDHGRELREPAVVPEPVRWDQPPARAIVGAFTTTLSLDCAQPFHSMLGESELLTC